MTKTTLAGIVAATIPFTIGDRVYNFRPLTLAILGQSCERYTDAMLPRLVDPREAMQALMGHSKDVVVAALKEFHAERLAALDPDPMVVIQWVMQSGDRIAQLMIDCVDGDPKPSIEQLALALDSEEGQKFADRWLEASGLKPDPTKRPSGPQDAAKQKMAKNKRPRRSTSSR